MPTPQDLREGRPKGQKDPGGHPNTGEGLQGAPLAEPRPSSRKLNSPAGVGPRQTHPRQTHPPGCAGTPRLCHPPRTPPGTCQHRLRTHNTHACSHVPICAYTRVCRPATWAVGPWSPHRPRCQVVYDQHELTRGGDATPRPAPRAVPLASELLHFKGWNKPDSGREPQVSGAAAAMAQVGNVVQRTEPEKTGGGPGRAPETRPRPHLPPGPPPAQDDTV